VLTCPEWREFLPALTTVRIYAILFDGKTAIKLLLSYRFQGAVGRERCALQCTERAPAGAARWPCRT
jgi:hypothetical protein